MANNMVLKGSHFLFYYTRAQVESPRSTGQLQGVVWSP